MFIQAYNTRGEKVRIPEHWMSNPVLKQGFSTTAPKESSSTEAGRQKKAHTTEAPATGDDKKE